MWDVHCLEIFGQIHQFPATCSDHLSKVGVGLGGLCGKFSLSHGVFCALGEIMACSKCSFCRVKAEIGTGDWKTFYLILVRMKQWCKWPGQSPEERHLNGICTSAGACVCSWASNAWCMCRMKLVNSIALNLSTLNILLRRLERFTCTSCSFFFLQ